MSTAIFLGPTLSINEAKTIYPDGWYFDPVKCGDIIKLIRLKPKRILIIDGFYEQTAAVWHKEILLAMDTGIEVFGASSMGALRAAELSAFGMQGIGKIADDFNSELLLDDDEVAVLHAPEKDHFKPLNDAMVNIRATLKQALKEKILTKNLENKIIIAAKNHFYIDRKLSRICDALEKSHPEEIQKFRQWLENGNVINQKRLDAIEALELMKNQPEKNLPEENQTEHSVFLRVLTRSMNTSTFDKPYSFLPETEKYLTALQKENPSYFLLVKNLASLLVFCHDFSHTIDPNIRLNNETLNLFIGRYQKDEKLQPLYQWIAVIVKNTQHFEASVKQHKKWVDLIYGKSDASQEKIRLEYAAIWAAFDIHNKNQKLHIAEVDFHEVSGDFFSEKGIQNQSELTVWLEKNKMESELNDFLLSLAYLKIIYIKNNYDFQLKKLIAEPFNWLSKCPLNA